jgi:hypothetical protein
MPDIMGTGAALFDYDNDGRLDLLLCHGRTRSRTAASALRELVLYRQRPDGTFTDVTEASGLGAQRVYAVGCAVGDVDNDGDLDLYVTCDGPDRLWRNDGGVFRDVTEEKGILNERWATAAAFFDYDRDGWLDLFVVNYLDYVPGSRCEDGSGRPDFCGPSSFFGTPDKLFHNLGGEGRPGAFEDVSLAMGIALASGPGLGAACRDFTGDGLPDIYVANDMAENRLWVQQASGRFVDEAQPRGVHVNRLGHPEASMGVVADDLNSDGRYDIFLTHLRGETNTFYQSAAQGLFDDRSAASGLGPPSLSETGFGAAAVDFDNDGDLDLMVANGRVKRAPPDPAAPPGDFWSDYAERPVIYEHTAPGRFVRRGWLDVRLGVGRALAVGDVDDDGDLDLLVTNIAGPARLYRNDLPADARGHWLRVEVVDSARRRAAIGAEVTVVAGGLRQTRTVTASGSYLSAHDVRLHFGLGPHGRFDRIEIRRVDGTVLVCPGGEADRILKLDAAPAPVLAPP